MNIIHYYLYTINYRNNLYHLFNKYLLNVASIVLGSRDTAVSKTGKVTLFS